MAARVCSIFVCPDNGIAASVCNIFVCPDNGMAASAWDFEREHRF